MKIPLFDIDGTLLQDSNPAHASAFDFVLHTVYKLMQASIEEVDATGKLDTQILVEVVKLHGIDDASAYEKMPEALQSMVNYYFSEVGSFVNPVLPGVTNVLGQLQEMHVPMGLLTGNIENIGRDKLTKAGLNQYFPFGGFGNEAYRRVELIEIARKKAEQVLKRQINKSELILVGDSPLDVQCAKEGGIPIISVATGKYSKNELQARGSNLVLSSLTELSPFLDFILH